MQEGSWGFLYDMLRQDLKGEECSVVRNRAGLEVWHQAVSSIPKAAQIFSSLDAVFL